MRTVRNPDGSSSLVFSGLLELPREDRQAREEVVAYAEDTFLRQRNDYLDVRRRAQEADDPRERARCREAARSEPPPSMDFCRDFSRKIRLRREAVFRSSLKS